VVVLAIEGVVKLAPEAIAVPPLAAVYQSAVPEQPVTDKLTVPGPQRLASTATGAAGIGLTVISVVEVQVAEPAVAVTV
jgi:hypothetical protein